MRESWGARWSCLRRPQDVRSCQRSPKEPESLDEQLRGRRDPTQFGRALEELDIRLIMAHTPQAKGRVERAWGTFQDRLVFELRLAGITTIEQANQLLWNFIPRYNQLFGVAPAQPGSACRQLPSAVSLDAVLSFKRQCVRVLRWDASPMSVRQREGGGAGRDDAGRPEWNSRMLDFALRVGFEMRLCRPYRAQTKGKVESGVKYVRRNLWPTVRFSDDAEMNRQGMEWCETVANERARDDDAAAEGAACEGAGAHAGSA